MKRALVLATLALVATTATGCTSAPGGSAGSASPSPSTTGASAGATPPTPGPGASRPSSGDVGVPRTLVLPSAVREQLIARWVSRTAAEREDVAGTSPGLTYYGFVPSTGTYWAVATFVPTPVWVRKAKAAPDSPAGLAFQDGPWVFSRQEGRAWRYVGDSGAMICPPNPPAQMIDVWGIPTTGC